MQKELINSAVNYAKMNNQGAKLALIKTFEPLMVSMGRRYNYENDLKEDFVQEGSLVLLRALESFDPQRGVPFPAYLKKQLFYHYINEAKHFRFTDSLDAPLGDEDLSLLDTLAIPIPDLDPLLESELHDLLKKCLDRLRSRQRWLIVEYYYHRRPLRDLANELNLSPSALSHYHRRTLKKLRNLLSMAGVDDIFF